LGERLCGEPAPARGAPGGHTGRWSAGPRHGSGASPQPRSLPPTSW
jgi:hypothetical protein